MRKLILTIPVFAVLALAAVKYNAPKPTAAQNMPSKGCCEPPPCFVDPTQCGR
jgi:hypothetical protein